MARVMRIHHIPHHRVTKSESIGSCVASTIPGFLERIPLFSGVHPFRLQHIAEAATVVSATRGKIILKPGDICEALFVVVYGHVAVALRSDTGAERVVEILAAGQAIGLAGLFSETGWRTEARALSDSKLLLIPRELVFAELAENRTFARSLLACISANVDRLLIDLEACTMQTARQRVASFLMRSIKPGQTRGERHVTLVAPKTVVASQLNLTAAHFSRVLHELSTAQLIRVYGPEVVIENEDGLRAYINGSSPAPA
jgi:CRP/FNR family transcriptional regulator, dissimilatory nitrate respiration regulator